MVTETVISALFEASITGMGLVLAVYALLTPISADILEQRATILEELIKKFNEDQSKLTDDSSDDDWQKHDQDREKIKRMRVLPWSFGLGIFIAFVFFSLSFLLGMSWLGSDVYRNSSIEFGIFAFCFSGWITFTSIGVSIIAEIVDYLTKNFEDIKKKQKAVEDSEKTVTYKGIRYRKKKSKPS